MDKSFGEAVRIRRKALRWSQARLAKEVGVTNLTVSNWERGKTFPHTKTFMKLREVLGTIY